MRLWEDGGKPLFHYLLISNPDGIACLRGAPEYPGLTGTVWFYQLQEGVLVVFSFSGLPQEKRAAGENCRREPVFGLHIHEGENCGGGPGDRFSGARGHYNPMGCPHPYHAGDLPPVFGFGGFGWGAVITGRFRVKEVVGRTVILHRMPDDFTSQPGGNSGERIACGVIV